MCVFCCGCCPSVASFFLNLRKLLYRSSLNYFQSRITHELGKVYVAAFTGMSRSWQENNNAPRTALKLMENKSLAIWENFIELLKRYKMYL